MQTKKVTLFALLTVLLLALVACGGAATEAPQPEPEEPDAPEATDAPVVEPTEAAPMEEFVGASVTNDACGPADYISAITANDEYTVTFDLCKPDPAFVSKVAFVPFGIQPAEYIEAEGGSGALLEAPIGTGPYALVEWARGESITYEAFADYWGEPAAADTLVFRWAAEGATRLLELQSGQVDYITNVSPDDLRECLN